MQVKIVLSDEAKGKFEEIVTFLASQAVSKAAASQYIQKLFTRIKTVLGTFPEAGKTLPDDPGLYQLVIEGYVFVYQYDPQSQWIKIVTFYRENQQKALSLDDILN